MQLTNGSPVVPGGHQHMGAWLNTRQLAPFPHVPGQGSIHLLREQARSRVHSELTTHSGRQPVVAGSPNVPVGHEHIALLPTMWHTAPGPHEAHGGSVTDLFC